MPRRSEGCSERLNNMLSSLDSTNESIDKVFVGGYSLRRRKTLGEEGGLTPATTRRTSRKTKNSFVTMTEPRPASKGRSKARGNQLSPIKDTPSSPLPPLNFDTGDDEDIVNERIGSANNEEVVENDSIARKEYQEEGNEEKEILDHQLEEETDHQTRDTDHDSDQRIETDDIDADQLIGSVDSGHEADSNTDCSIDQDQQVEYSQEANPNVGLKSKLMEELHRMQKFRGYYEKNTERFPVEGLQSVAELLKHKKKNVLVMENKKIINKLKRKDRIPATVNSHIRKGSKVKVLLSSKHEEDSRITSAQQFRNDRLYNNSQYKRESGYYALLKRSKRHT